MATTNKRGGLRGPINRSHRPPDQADWGLMITRMGQMRDRVKADPKLPQTMTGTQALEGLRLALWFASLFGEYVRVRFQQSPAPAGYRLGNRPDPRPVPISDHDQPDLFATNEGEMI
jgi:hypothetical protein